MEDQAPEEVKHERLKRLLYLTERITAEKNSALRGKTLEVLVEGVSKTHPGRLTGRTRTNKIVHFEGDAGLTGKLVNVNITDPQSWSLFGEVTVEKAEN